MARVPRMQQPAPAQMAALAPALPADAPHPIRFEHLNGALVAAYSPAQLDRPTAWQLLTELFGQLTDVTPAWVAGAAA
jgi:hypothetical protein